MAQLTSTGTVAAILEQVLRKQSAARAAYNICAITMQRTTAGVNLLSSVTRYSPSSRGIAPAPVEGRAERQNIEPVDHGGNPIRHELSSSDVVNGVSETEPRKAM